MKTITVTRYRLINPGRAPRWAYNYVVEGDPMTCQYGPGLRDLRSMLRERHPGSIIVETWKTR
jgi:hypothetical protein